MNHETPSLDPVTFRWSVYGLLAAISIGITVARIIGVEQLYDPSIYHAYPNRNWPAVLPKQMPTFSSNDRSRWATVKALVEQGTFVIGHHVEDESAPNGLRIEGILSEPGYGTIDVMRNPETWEFFSTKPPLFTVMVAGEYGLLKKLFGWSLDEDRWPVVCTILITFNVIPLMIFLLLFARLLEEYGTSDWGRIFLFAVASMGTFLNTFAVTLNNHTPCACCVLFAIYPLLAGRQSGVAGRYSLTTLFTSGFFAGLSICLDLPSASLAGSLGLLLLLGERSYRSVLMFIVAMLIPLMALIFTNYLALNDWKPGYSNFGGPWYEYPNSHWAKAKMIPPPTGIDFANEPKHVYAFHLLLGHHGLFSLTPIWLFGLWAMARSLFQRRSPFQLLHALSLLILIVVIGFYIFKTNNYGGFSSGPRWFFWLTPLFLLSMIPLMDRLANSTTARWIAYLALAVGCFSAFYPVANPWRHPWIYQLCEYSGWLKY